jgi:hypothetical protein
MIPRYIPKFKKNDVAIKYEISYLNIKEYDESLTRDKYTRIIIEHVDSEYSYYYFRLIDCRDSKVIHKENCQYIDNHFDFEKINLKLMRIIDNI